MNISVFIPCQIPSSTAQQKGCMVRNGRPRFFKKAKVVQAERSFFALLQPHAPAQPFDGPVCLVIRFHYPWRKSEKKSVVRGFKQYPITTRPDLSNIIKSVEDVMTTLRFWHDDGQISSLSVSKCYSDTPGIDLTITYDNAKDKNGCHRSVDELRANLEKI